MVMIIGYVDNGRFDEARELYYRMPNNNVVADGYDNREGRQMHVLVMKDGFELDLSLCHSLITMYDKWGSILDAEQAFRQMNRAYALFHGIQLFLHLHIMLEKASKVICEMPLEADGGVWGALLAACSAYLNIELGELAAKKIVEWNP
ncbi:hypothetical protein V6N11_024362 [Hibiscus sabdariffa]|uniref:Pentatricopeptide repeat-containing protein n=1 Tax=Hibiscus sabdariffa TaxID=183260 RepID=A0ABR1ZU30_9ROSI